MSFMAPASGIRIIALTAFAISLALAVAGCGVPADNAPLCGDTRTVTQVYYGTSNPTFAPLTPGQVMAIGQVGPCSGTLIAPTWALSAQHCGLAPGALFCVGPDPANPDTCVPVAAVHNDPDPDSDLAVLELEQDPRALLAGLEFIPIMTEPLDTGWYGELAEGAGYGEAEDGSFGVRYFTAEPIAELNTLELVVDGQGVHGLCLGDSGGPVLVIASDATARVAGALLGGDSSCVGIDRYTRVDRVVGWIESLTGPTQVGPAYCGVVDEIGMCTGGRAVWCDGGVLRSETCAAQGCGWDGAGFRCVASPDPCQGYDRRGACEDNVALWCESGQLLQRTCDQCSERCYIAGSPEGAYCVAHPCGSLDFLGRCNGDVAEWCEGNGIRSVDCGARGQRCGYVDDETGYYCM